MGVLDKFLNAMKLNDDEDMDDDEFLDDEVDEFEEERPKKHLFKDRDEDDDDEDDKKRRTKSSQVKSMQKQRTTRQSTQVVSSTSSKVSPIRPRRKNNITISGEISVLKPHSFEEANQITEALLNNCTVILNLEETLQEDIQRIVDFSSGTCYALNGTIEQISRNNNKMFVITPETVELSGDFEKTMGSAIDVHSRF